jgi:protein phosphatase
MNIIKGIFNPKARKTDELVFGITDVGKKRDHNEDAYHLLPNENILIVADGMGGHNAGEVASMNAVDIAGKYFTPERLIQMRANRVEIKQQLINALTTAHQGVVDLAKTNAEYCSMGCTMIIAFISEQILYTCHVGDSRVYLINQAGISQITNDHTTVADLVRTGKMTAEEARYSPISGQLTQALGGPMITPEYSECPINKDDLVLLCSDGLWDMLMDEEIFKIANRGGSLEQTGLKLIEKANEAGGNDNITVILAKAV